MRLFHYPDAERHPFGAHGLLLALPLTAALWVAILAIAM